MDFASTGKRSDDPGPINPLTKRAKIIPASQFYAVKNENEVSKRFDDLQKIGKGAYSNVFKARSRESGQYVALKRCSLSGVKTDFTHIAREAEFFRSEPLRYLGLRENISKQEGETPRSC